MGVFAYIKNGTKYKMNQFPGAYPANRVSYNGSDVETALDELNADITNKIGYVDVNVTGTAVTIADGSWYYSASVPVTIPSGTRLFNCTYAGAFNAGVFPIINANSSFTLIAYKSLTMPSVIVRCWYVVKS